MRLPILALVAAAAVASAETQSYNASTTAFGNNTYNSLALTKFDTSLGTLTSVTLTLNELSIEGFFSATAIGGNGQLSFFGTTARLQQNPVNTLGFAAEVGTQSTDDALVVNPGVGTLLTQDIAQQFSITKYIFVTNEVTTVDSSLWSAYQANGGGYIYFQLKNNPQATVTAPTGQFTTTNATAFADITVTYTYTPSPVPEPSTYGAILGGLALAGAAIRRRRKAA